MPRLRWRMKFTLMELFDLYVHCLCGNHYNISHLLHQYIIYTTQRIIKNKQYISEHTRWCWKKVVKDIQPKPMCWNILITLLAELPATRMEKDKRKFPAGIRVPVIVGWLFHVFSRFGCFSLLHVVSHRVYLFIYIFIYIYASTVVLMCAHRNFGPGK